MRHKKNNTKLGRSPSHLKATIAALVCALIEQKRIKTTLQKAKQARTFAEKLVTVARKGLAEGVSGDVKLALRRQIIKKLTRAKYASMLMDDIAPVFKDRPGGYTRITKLGKRSSDSSEMVYLEWVDMIIPDKTKKKQDAKEVAA